MRPPRRLVVIVVPVALVIGYLALRPGDRSEVGPAPTAKAIAHVDRAVLLRNVHELAAAAMEGRGTGTAGGRRARTWVETRFKSIGLEPDGDKGYGYLQPFSFTRWSLVGFFLPNRPFREDYKDAANVIGRIDGAPGRRPILISAHYDHWGVMYGSTYPGANDNATGVATLLAVAGYFRRNPPHHPLIFASFDAEELGMEGALKYVTSRPGARDILLNINLDMLARSRRNEIYAAGTSYTPSLKAVIEEVQTRSAVRIRFGHDRPVWKGGTAEDWTDNSDHFSFHSIKVPWLCFAVEDPPDYHAPGDVAERIEMPFLGDVADMVVETVRTFDAKLR